MKVYRSANEYMNDPIRTTLEGKSVVTVGNFDGVHRGHQLILKGVVENALARRLRSLAITFEPHPSRILHPERSPRLITPLARKLELLAEAGLDAALVLPFTQRLAEMSPLHFTRVILGQTAIAREVHEGTSFRFGHRGQGTLRDLIEFGREEEKFDVFSYDPLLLRGAPVSSSRIRTLIAAGKLAEARALLTRPFSIDSTPAPGRGYGSKYTVPTINLAPYPDLLPAQGVYITTLTIAAQTFPSVTNIGNRPTFGPDSFAIETHLLNPDTPTLQSLTETTPLRLTFLRRLRPEITFDSTPALRTQIARDIARAHRYFSLCRTLGRDPRTSNLEP